MGGGGGKDNSLWRIRLGCGEDEGSIRGEHILQHGRPWSSRPVKKQNTSSLLHVINPQPSITESVFCAVYFP